MPRDSRVIAVGSMKPSDLLVLRGSLDQLWPVDESPCFGSLLQAIDSAEGEARGGREVEESPDRPTLSIKSSG